MNTVKNWPDEKMQSALESAERRALKSGGGPPDNGDMPTSVDQRLTQVEIKLEHIAHDVGQFKWFLLGAALTMILAVIGTGIAIQQMTVATFQAAGAQANPPQPQVPPIIINVPSQPAAQAPPSTK